MTGEIFANAMETLDSEFQKDGIHATMLLDNFSGHKWQKDKISNIEFILFTPNLTLHVQPADAGIIHTLKAHYHQLTLPCSLDCEEAEEDDPFAINLLTAMQLLACAWDQVTPATIAACWRHAGILPSSRVENVVEPVAEPVVEPVAEVQAAVDKAAEALASLNLAIHKQTDEQANLAKPALVDNIEELLKELPEPQWLNNDDDNDDVQGLIGAV